MRGNSNKKKVQHLLRLLKCARDRAIASKFDLDCALPRFYDLNLDCALPRGLDRDLDCAIALARDLDPTLSREFTLVRDLPHDRDLNRALIGVIDRALERIHSSNFSPAKSARSSSLNVNTSRRPIRVLRILGAFAWFCSKENREHIEFITADLKKDTDAMRRKKYREIFVQCVLLWHVANTVLPIMWDGLRRLLAAILPVGKIISKIKGL